MCFLCSISVLTMICYGEFLFLPIQCSLCFVYMCEYVFVFRLQKFYSLILLKIWSELLTWDSSLQSAYNVKVCFFHVSHISYMFLSCACLCACLFIYLLFGLVLVLYLQGLIVYFLLGHSTSKTFPWVFYLGC